MLKNIMKAKNTYLILLVVMICIIIVLTNITDKESEVLKKSEENNFKKIEEVKSNKKIGWGIKREKNHIKPDVGRVNKEILEKYKGICLESGDTNKIYLTFDEGYEAGYTDEILDILKMNKIKATFFLTAHYVNTNEELVKQMIEEGHIIGNHTVNHKSMPTLNDEEIEKEIMELHNVSLEKFQYNMKYIRPPMGEFSERTLDITNKLGYITTMWSFAYEDWNENKQPTKEYAINKILENVHSGEIILLHGNSKTNMEILEEVIKKIKEMGYLFASLDEFEK